MNDRQADVLVIGGGPAGLSAAARLAQLGAQVLLCETRHYPHDKMCGEFLSPEVPGLLAGLGLDDAFARLQPALIHQARLTAPDGSQWLSDLPGEAWGASRRVLDAALAEHARRAGVQVWEGSTVQEVQGNLAGGFFARITGRQDCEVRARLVLGAHGKRAALDRSLNRHFIQTRQPYLALKAHFEGPSVPGRIELHGFPGGYCGMSEIEGGRLVACLLVHEHAFRQASGRHSDPVERFIHWMQAQNPYLREWFAGARRLHARWISISQVCFSAKPAIERDILMVGDAAGLIAPLAGNGISIALAGGRLAAGVALDFLGGSLPAGDLRRQYPSVLQKAFGQRLALGRILQPLMVRPAALSLALRLLRSLPPLGNYLVTHTRARRSL